MEITLEKVELVKDRTGVSYKEAKEALEAADGNVVDAIVGIEETINLTTKGKVNDQAKQLLDKVKVAVEKGNVARIRVKKEDEVVLNLPVNIGILGTVMAPLAAVIGAVAAFGTKCTIELLKDDGSVVDISEKAEEKLGSVVEKGSDIAETIKDKGTIAFNTVSEKVQDTVNKTINAEKENAAEFKDAVDEMWEEAKERVDKAADGVSEATSDMADKAEEVKGEASAAFSNFKSEAAEKFASVKDEAVDKIEDLKEEVSEIKEEIKIKIDGIKGE